MKPNKYVGETKFIVKCVHIAPSNFLLFTQMLKSVWMLCGKLSILDRAMLDPAPHRGEMT
jgi:hypothetical protein